MVTMPERTKVVNTTIAIMSDGIGVFATCPVCGHQADFHTVKPNNLATPYLVQCGDPEEGKGCGNWYVIRVAITATVTGHSIQD